MAHSDHKKARVLALLLIQERVGTVSRITGVPKQTVSRWKQTEYPKYAARYLAPLAQRPDIQGLLRHFSFKRGN